MSKLTAETVEVIFRKWDEGGGGGVFALMPYLAGSTADRYAVDSYSAEGHSAADYDGCIRNSRPATAEGFAPLLAQMERIGYAVRAITRASRSRMPGRS